MNTYNIIKWVGMVLLATIAAALFYIERLTDPFYPTHKFVVTVLGLMIMGLISMQVLFFIRKPYQAIEDTRRRVMALCIITPLVTAIWTMISVPFFDATQFWGFDLTMKNYVYDYGANLIFASLVIVIYEGFYIFNQWKSTTLESEQLKQEQLQTQLELLKNQVNPHFLFNSLNSLSSLIEVDDKKAKTFIEELAQVYRYLLQSNEQELTTLGKELEFIKAYTFLLKTRFSKGFNINIDISEKSKMMLIPPLTLQLLVENAVKHNVVAVSRPLIVHIFEEKTTNFNQNTEGGNVHLTVSNNLQKKQANVLSNRLGLQNIIKKYKLLGQLEVKVEETETEFKVVLPLIS